MLDVAQTKKKIFIFFFINFFLILKKINFFFVHFNFFFLFKLKYFCFKFFQNKLFFFYTEKNDFQSLLEDSSTFLNDKILIDKKSYFNKLNNFNFTFTRLNFNDKFYHKILDFFFLNSFLPTNSFFPRTGFFRLFFYKSSKSSSYLINLNKVMSRWLDFFNLVLNVYAFGLSPLVYSSPFFKQEALALNWNTNLWDVNSWNHSFPFFIFKTNHFSQKTDFFYKKLSETDATLFIVTDCLYHFKNLYFFKKNFFYTIGLVSLNINPWLVSYPVIASSNSYLNQIFFIKSIIYSQKKAYLLKFSFFKKLWNFSFLLNNVIKY